MLILQLQAGYFWVFVLEYCHFVLEMSWKCPEVFLQNLCGDPEWLDDPCYSHWLKKKSDEVALWSYWKKVINIGNMGETGLTSHLKGKKHKEISEFSCTNPITSLLKKPIEIENKYQDNMPQTSKKQVGIDGKQCHCQD